MFAILYWLYRNRDRLGGGAGYAIDPVCGMQVETANAPAHTIHDGHTHHFCSDRCRERFEREPDRFRAKDSSPSPSLSDAMHQEGDAIDPVCGMRVDSSTAAARRRLADHEYCFCSQGCAEAFDRAHHPA